MPGRSKLLHLALATVLAAAPTVSAVAGEPAGPPGRDLVGPGVAIGAAGGPCSGIFQLPSGRPLPGCTHGPDPELPPPVARPTVPAPLGPNPAPGLLLPEPAGADPAPGAPRRGIRCYGDGQSGNRVHVLYARASDRRDRFASLETSLRRWVEDADAAIAASAARYGAVRHLRFVTDSRCRLVIDRVTLTPVGDDAFATTVVELATQGYDRPDRKYLVFVDANVLCGIGHVYNDPSKRADNYNNGHPLAIGMVARVDTKCWGQGVIGHSVEAHELVHNLGGVQATAPNGSKANHCDDDHDLMCYEDGTVLALNTVCPQEDEGLLDCRGDDYFNPSPPAGSWLATHWNTAESAFLEDAEGLTTAAVGDAGVVEGDSGQRTLRFTVSLSAPAAQPISMTYSTGARTATAQVDYLITSGTLTFDVGEQTKEVVVPIVGDTFDERHEQVALVITSASGVVVSDAEGTGTIADDDPGSPGYWLMSDRGVVSRHGAVAAPTGPAPDLNPGDEIAAIAPTPSGRGYWLVSRLGLVFNYGDAPHFGSFYDEDLFITAITPSRTGRGYALVNYDGRVFPFGDVVDLGLSVGFRVPETIWAAAVTPTGRGYWLAGQSGRVYTYGDAGHFGELPPLGPGESRPSVYAFAPTPTGRGYWVVTADGTVSAFGDAPLIGSHPTGEAVVAVASTPSGQGYWLVDVTGRVSAFGDAPDLGGRSGSSSVVRILGMAALGSDKPG